MSTFALTRLAKSDLKAIAKFTEKRWGQAQRNLYIKQFDDTFHMLAGTPTVGKSCDFIMKSYQKFPQGSHVIFYKTSADSAIEIVRILHKSMDINSRFEKS